MRWLILLLVLLPTSSHALQGVLFIDDDVVRGHSALYRTAGVDDFDGSGEIATPTIDAMAADGVRLDDFTTYRVCSPTRASLFFGTYTHRHSNLTGMAQNIDTGSTRDIEPNPYQQTIVSRLQDLGVGVGLFGKLHLERQEWISRGEDESYMEALGLDYAEVISPSNPGKIGPNPDSWDAGEQDCLSHNERVVCTKAGVCSMSTTYSTHEIRDAVIARIQERYLNDPTGDYLWIVSFPAAHSPYEAGDTNNCNSGTDTQDDRKPGSALATSSTKTTVYEEMLEELDAAKQLILDELNDGSGIALGADTDFACSMSDNGTPLTIVRPAVCGASYGKKGTPFPCGTSTSFVCQGGAIASGKVMTGLHHPVDVMPTMLELFGGTATGADGIGFGDCMMEVNGKTVTGCASHETVSVTAWNPLGGTTSEDIQRPPRCGDPDDEWTKWEPAHWTMVANEKRLLVRTYDVSDTAVGCSFQEELYQVHGTTDIYLASATVPIADSGVGGGAIEAGDFAVTATADQLTALAALQRGIAAEIARDGALRPTLAGVNY